MNLIHWGTLSVALCTASLASGWLMVDYALQIGSRSTLASNTAEPTTLT